MKVFATPVLFPNVNWEPFLRDAAASLGRSPARSLDGAGATSGDVRSFLAMLGEFERPGTKPFQYVHSTEALRALDLFNFVFLVSLETEDFIELLKASRFEVLMAEDRHRYRVALVSGNLRQWREGIIETLRPTSSTDLRRVLSDVLRFFLEAKLQDLFRGFDLIKIPDGTLALESKR